jgi:type II secretory pathway component GspD/PulD (secretin)
MGGYGGGMGGYGGMGGMSGMGGYGGGMMGGMGGYGMGGMGGMGGYGMGGMGGMGGYGGMMGGYGGGMGMTGYMSGIMAQSLRYLIEQTIEPDTWFDLSNTGEGTITPYPDQQPKKLVVYQSPEVHQQIRDMLDQLRKSLGNEVSIEARFLAVTENFLEDIGMDVDFSYNLGGDWGIVTVAQDSFLNVRPTQTNVSGSIPGLSSTPAMGLQAGYGSVLDDLQVSLLLRATQGRTDSKSLSAPKVTVLSGESAFFYLQDYLSYALPPTVSQGTTGTLSGGLTSQGIYTPQSIGTFPVGSNLTITPTITKDRKHVLLNVITTQTDLLRFKQHIVSAPIPGTTGGTTGGTTNTSATVLTYPVEVPETETANVMTRVSVPDRGTLLLGGHKITAAVEKESGVPILSKIPIVNLLFSNRSSVRDQKVLLILVKPTIILQEETDQEAVAAMEENPQAGSGL